MRLIDADKFKGKAICSHTYGGVLKIINIDDIPTAYDIDKVVAELEKKKEEVQRMRNTCVALSDLEVCDIENVTYKRAIEIVKHGVVADDMCKWKQDKGCVGLGAYNISCCDKTLEMPVSTARGLKYCTYCGKKIKVVE